MENKQAGVWVKAKLQEFIEESRLSHCYLIPGRLPKHSDWVKIYENAILLFNEWLDEQPIPEFSFEQRLIDFGVWYSGMERQKVEKAYNRFLKESAWTPPQQPIPVNQDIYSGELNTERIKEYRKLAELYNISEGSVRDIFCRGADWALSQLKSSPTPVQEGLREETIREIAWIAWKGAANAFRMYPDNKHTFTDYWNAAKNQFEEFKDEKDK